MNTEKPKGYWYTEDTLSVVLEDMGDQYEDDKRELPEKEPETDPQTGFER